MSRNKTIDYGTSVIDALTISIGLPPSEAIEHIVAFPVPTEFTEGATANYTTADLPFRTDAIYIYESTAGRSFQFDLQLVQISSATAKDDVENKVNTLLASQYPVLNSSNSIIGMPVAYLTFGQRFKSMRGLISDVNIVWSGPYSDAGFYSAATVSFVFKHAPLKNVDIGVGRDNSPSFKNVLDGTAFNKGA